MKAQDGAAGCLGPLVILGFSELAVDVLKSGWPGLVRPPVMAEFWLRPRGLFSGLLV